MRAIIFLCYGVLLAATAKDVVADGFTVDRGEILILVLGMAIADTIRWKRMGRLAS